VSISPKFYKQNFGTIEIFAPLLYLQFGFVIFWQKNIGSKTACKMLKRLATGANAVKKFTPIKGIPYLGV